MANRKALDYPALSRQLDDIVAKLQDDNTSIDEALQLYQQGIKLVEQMEEFLKNAENQLRKVSPGPKGK